MSEIGCKGSRVGVGVVVVIIKIQKNKINEETKLLALNRSTVIIQIQIRFDNHILTFHLRLVVCLCK